MIETYEISGDLFYQVSHSLKMSHFETLKPRREMFKNDYSGLGN